MPMDSKTQRMIADMDIAELIGNACPCVHPGETCANCRAAAEIKRLRARVSEFELSAGKQAAAQSQTPEQEARDMLERVGVDDAQSLSAGDVAELANLIASARYCDALRTAVDRLLELTSDLEIDSVGQDWPELLEAVKRVRAVRGGTDD